jgi:hypothetical protein
VLRVVKVLPQVQVTVVSTYSGWMPLFTGSLLGLEVAGSCRAGRAHVNRNLLQCARPLNGATDTAIPVLSCGCVAQPVLGSRVRNRALAERSSTG